MRRRLAGVAPRDFRIFVNVSPGYESLDKIIERHRADADLEGVPLTGLGIEITEQAIVAEPTAASRALAVARSRGLAVVLDDVGTGYSSLSLIRALPLDGLKIDCSFVQGMLRDAADAALVAAVAALGRRLGLRVTAEGVESEEQLRAVRRRRCRRGSGLPVLPGRAGRPAAGLAARGRALDRAGAGALHHRGSVTRRVGVGARP